MTLFNLSVDQSDADPVVDSSTFSDLRPVVGLNVDTSTSFAVTSTLRQRLINVDVGNSIGHRKQMGYHTLVILTKPN